MHRKRSSAECRISLSGARSTWRSSPYDGYADYSMTRSTIYYIGEVAAESMSEYSRSRLVPSASRRLY